MAQKAKSRSTGRRRASGRVKGNLMVRLGEAVRRLRRKKGMSQVAFGVRVGLDRTYICHIERGARDVPLSSLSNLARGFGMSLSELFVGID